MSNLERKRRAQGITQTQLAIRLGVDQSTVSRWEKGEFMPEPRFFPELAKVFGITAEEVTHLFAPEPAPSAA